MRLINKAIRSTNHKQTALMSSVAASCLEQSRSKHLDPHGLAYSLKKTENGATLTVFLAEGKTSRVQQGFYFRVSLDARDMQEPIPNLLRQAIKVRFGNDYPMGCYRESADGYIASTRDIPSRDIPSRDALTPHLCLS